MLAVWVDVAAVDLHDPALSRDRSGFLSSVRIAGERQLITFFRQSQVCGNFVPEVSYNPVFC